MIKEKDNMRLLIELRDQNLPNDSLALTNNDSTQWSVGTTTSVRAKFFVLNEKRTIREIIDSTLLPAHVVVGLLPQSSSSLLAKPYVPFGAATKLYSNGQELYRVDTSDPHRFTKALMCPYGLHALIRSLSICVSRLLYHTKNL
ncbi:BnaA10g28690D [Brassica napus]|uniref:BnaA10g28690D protein n=1 Tax=Brassica napus TaxID=3708 RepID=A0A078J2N1_BRANA|nr:BnaA10g28690D [Brassica napus]